MRFSIYIFSFLAFLTVSVHNPARANQKNIARNHHRPGKEKNIKLPNGLVVKFIEASELPIVGINLIIHSGTHQDPKRKRGLSSLTARLVTKGTNSRSSQQIVETFNYLGTSLDVTSDRNSIVYSCLTLRWDFDNVVNLLADIILFPAFEMTEFVELKGQILDKIESRKIETASKSTAEPHYCKLSPQTEIPGTPNTIRRISKKDVRKFYLKWFHPENATLVIEGKIDSAKMLKSIYRHFKWWPGRASRRERN